MSSFFLPRGPRMAWSGFKLVAAPGGHAATCLLASSDHAAKSLLGKTRIAAFDLDGTLIRTRSGNTFPKNENDWIEWKPSLSRATSKVLGKLKEAHEQGYSLVIFTNQNHSIDSLTMKRFQSKMESICCDKFKLPITVLASFQKDVHRKPMPGMFDILQELTGQPIDLEHSFYVGDAANRPQDHSGADIKFALNTGLKFYTPEAYFEEDTTHIDKHPIKLTGMNVIQHLEDPGRLPTVPANLPIAPRRLGDGEPDPPPECVFLIGPPCCGKTTWFKKHFEPRGYLNVSKEISSMIAMHTQAPIPDALAGTSMVVESPLGEKFGGRQAAMSILQKAGITRFRAFVWTDLRLAWHNNLYRSFIQPCEDVPARPKLVSIGRFLQYQTEWQPPSRTEGFETVVMVNMQFEGSPEDKKRYAMYLELGGKANQAFEDKARNQLKLE